MHKTQLQFSLMYFNWNTSVTGHKQSTVGSSLCKPTAKVNCKLHSHWLYKHRQTILMWKNNTHADRYKFEVCYEGLPFQMDVSSSSTVLCCQDFDYSITISLVFHLQASSATMFEEICEAQKCSPVYVNGYIFKSC